MKELLNHIIHQIDRVEDKIQKADDKLDDIDKTLIVQEKNLQEHMRRTELLENEQKEFRKDIQTLKDSKIQIKSIYMFIIKASPVICAAVAAIYKYIM